MCCPINSFDNYLALSSPDEFAKIDFLTCQEGVGQEKEIEFWNTKSWWVKKKTAKVEACPNLENATNVLPQLILLKITLS